VVKSKGGDKSPTSLGNIVKGFLDFLSESLGEEHWKYTAIDDLTGTSSSLPMAEYFNIVSTLMTDNSRRRLYWRDKS
jgi:hypothetical protein